MTSIARNDGIVNQGAHLRRSILELAPLELDCMNALWSVGEGTVRQIQQLMANTRPRAYTTIMTILDRLAQKGVVAREKSGRAYMYRANLTAEQARTHAIERIVVGFFEGSTQALAAQLAGAPAIRASAALGVVLPTAPTSEGRALNARRKSDAPSATTADSAPSTAGLDAVLL